MGYNFVRPKNPLEKQPILKVVRLVGLNFTAGKHHMKHTLIMFVFPFVMFVFPFEIVKKALLRHRAPQHSRMSDLENWWNVGPEADI